MLEVLNIPTGTITKTNELIYTTVVFEMYGSKINATTDMKHCPLEEEARHEEQVNIKRLRTAVTTTKRCKEKRYIMQMPQLVYT